MPRRGPQPALQHRQRAVARPAPGQQARLLPVQGHQQRPVGTPGRVLAAQPRVQQVQHLRAQLRIVRRQRQPIQLLADRLLGGRPQQRLEQRVRRPLDPLGVAALGQRAALQPRQLHREQRAQVGIVRHLHQPPQRLLHLAGAFCWPRLQRRQQQRQQRRRVPAVQLQRRTVGGAGVGRAPQAILQQPPLLHQHVGPVGGRGQRREPQLGVQQPQQVLPGAPAREHPEQCPGVRLQRGIGGERLGVDLARLAQVALALAQPAHLVPQARVPLRVGGQPRRRLAVVKGDLLVDRRGGRGGDLPFELGRVERVRAHRGQRDFRVVAAVQTRACVLVVAIIRPLHRA